MNDVQIFSNSEFGEIRTVIIDGEPWFVAKDIAEKLIIQYGGSVKAENVKALMAKENIDGALVGGASLSVDKFLPIIAFNK